ncbi:hypothetical protein [Streptomonospora wellingtoniae]|uniref:Uncharacterized protein n=1 Tax=Streptomonospora wellingtoniae TaxID=3075544 RepID=A0ABU2KPV4_9ACTN|nr:hypothetical protein [Streptomonospora sp. DSM 45055]MDT0301309.1 hypothetical protein [Streptomonospora sp. DSM 45055]
MDERVLRGWHRSLVRMQLRVQSRPQRAALVAGVLAGVLFGAMTGLLTATGQIGSRTGQDMPAWLAWAAGGVGGVFFWRFARRVNPAPLPPETDPDALIAARRKLRQGRRSQDPEVDGLVVHLLGQMRAVKRWSDPRWLAWVCGVVFSLGLGSNIAALLMAPHGLRWINMVGIVVFGGFLCVLPWTVRSARRTRALAESVEASQPTDEQ